MTIYFFHQMILGLGHTVVVCMKRSTRDIFLPKNSVHHYSCIARSCRLLILSRPVPNFTLELHSHSWQNPAGPLGVLFPCQPLVSTSHHTCVSCCCGPEQPLSLTAQGAFLTLC
jgi:hypothetical protein